MAIALVATLGLVFTGWGVLVAVFSVWGAPRLQGRFGTVPTLYANLTGLSLVLVAIAAGVHHPGVAIVAVIVSGAFIGINNTLTTQAVMMVSPVERPVASSAYGFVRFIGGGLAPYVAGKIADATDQSVAFFVGAAAFALAIPVLARGATFVRAAERGTEEAQVPAPSLEPVGPTAAKTGSPVIVAVGATDDAAAVVDAAAELAAREGAPLQVVHVRETEIVEELAVDAEEPEAAAATVAAHLERLAAHGIAATGLVLHSVGDHASAGRVLAAHAADVDARLVALGRSPRGHAVQFADGSITAALVHDARLPVALVVPGEEATPLTAESVLALQARA